MARATNYDKFPAIDLHDHAEGLSCGYSAIAARLDQFLRQSKQPGQILTIDTYPGVDDTLLVELVRRLKPTQVVNTLDVKKSEVEVRALVDRNLTNDRIFGVLSCHELQDFFDPHKLAAAEQLANNWSSGLLIIYGVGAALIARGDCLVYADMARWEIQQRYRRGVSNWGADNGSEDFFRKYKRGYFVEWRVADRHKARLFSDVDFFLDANSTSAPKLLTGNALRAGLQRAATRPFRVVPFFDPAPWGGQWMKEVCDLDRSAHNYGWCFDCVPEENSLLFDLRGVRYETPAINVVHQHPIELLGEKVHARFGKEFPIRFDFLDTMGGGHLSFQVHPLTEYIQQAFGMHYTQDESYYMLDAGDDATVYLGFQDNVDRDAVTRDLREAQKSADHPFPAEKHVTQWPARKHDHFLIPAGTVHCSGKNGMVLEISATPYIFTFKMWDWGRVGLDGRPRPIHLDHALANVQWNRTTNWVGRNLVNRIEAIGHGDGWREERTGLHEREFIETRRHWFTRPVAHDTRGGVNVLNLVQGDEAVVESPAGAFDPFVVHFAETFIVPAAVGPYRIRPSGPSTGTECATIKAYVRT